MAVTSTVEFEVRWGECDPAGIIYHPTYLDWFSVTRMHLFREHGAPYMTSFHDNGVVLVVLGVECEFRKALRAEDRVLVTATLVDITRTRMSLEYRVCDDAGEQVATGRTRHAFVDKRQRAINVAKKSPELWDLLTRMMNSN